MQRFAPAHPRLPIPKHCRSPSKTNSKDVVCSRLWTPTISISFSLWISKINVSCLGLRHIFLDSWKKDGRRTPLSCLFCIFKSALLSHLRGLWQTVGFQLWLAVGDKKRTQKKRLFHNSSGSNLASPSCHRSDIVRRLLWTTRTIDSSLTATSNVLFRFCQGRRRSPLIWILPLNINTGPFALDAVLPGVRKQVSISAKFHIWTGNLQCLEHINRQTGEILQCQAWRLENRQLSYIQSWNFPSACIFKGVCDEQVLHDDGWPVWSHEHASIFKMPLYAFNFPPHFTAGNDAGNLFPFPWDHAGLSPLKRSFVVLHCLTSTSVNSARVIATKAA